MSSQTLLVKIMTERLFGQCTFSRSHQTTVLTADHRPAHLKKDRDLDHAHAMGIGRTRVGGSTDALSLCLKEQTRHVVRSRWVWWRTWVLIIICLTKQTRHVKRSIWVWWRTWVLCRPCMWVPDIVIIFLCVTSITSHIYRNNAT